MKKQLIFIIIFLLLPIGNIYSKSVNLIGDTILYPGGAHGYLADNNIHSNDLVDWKVTNGVFVFYSGIKNADERNNEPYYYTEYTSRGPYSEQVEWNDTATIGRLSYTVRNNPAKQGYIDVEILSVKDSQVDNVTIGNFHIYSDIIYIPKGESGYADCSASMIYPATVDGSVTPVTKFKWEFPVSLGGQTIETEADVSIAYDANSGDGEKITVTPLAETYSSHEIISDGKPRSFTIKRFEGIIENRDITGNETFSWENLLVRNVNIFPGANVTLHGNNSVLLSPEFYAYPGSSVYITVSGINNLVTNSQNKGLRTKTTSGIENGFGKADECLSQNYPNPCSGNTTIGYCLPDNTGEASLYVVSSTGHVVRSLSIGERGNQTLNLDVSVLSPGLYLYYVVADGKMLGTRRMVVADR